MADQTPIYDLMLLLSREVPEEQRTKILSDLESAISSGNGSIDRRSDWGTRAMSYRINHQAEADYHLLQFSGPPALLESLSHDLHITDGVLRFRIIKVLAGTPVPPEHPPPVIAPVSSAHAGSGSREGSDGREPAADAEG
jgi:small subunit ribosomal protein S6